MNIIFIIISAVWFILPAYVANGSGLLFGGGQPVDMNKTLMKEGKSINVKGHEFGVNDIGDGRRIIGNGVTWRGTVGGTIAGTLIGGVLGLIGQTTHFTINQISGGMISPIVYGDVYSGLILGFLLAFGALLGDAIGSFIKRRIGIERGKSAPVLDQLDFVIVAIILSLFVVELDIWFIILICALTLIIHLLTNSIAYLLGLKDIWY
ncbi:MAG: CDP-2,3-bis-(O-geranylgeranyl)-sn-glycerol synthase [archaeon]|nr:CDP-2,3-bis-(O-geranylgeranyl)-sn-glycerol synthase [archaeon]